MKTILIIGPNNSGKTFIGNALEEYYKREGLRVRRFYSDRFAAAVVESIAEKDNIDILVFEILELGQVKRFFRRTLYQIIHTKKYFGVEASEKAVEAR